MSALTEIPVGDAHASSELAVAEIGAGRMVVVVGPSSRGAVAAGARQTTLGTDSLTVFEPDARTAESLTRFGIHVAGTIRVAHGE